MPLLFLLFAAAFAQQCTMPTSLRFDCYPQAGANQSVCEARGCCWNTATEPSAMIGIPFCFYPTNYGYSLASVQTTSTGYTGTLTQSSPPSPYGKDVSTLKLDVFFETQKRIRFRITDPSKTRYTVPLTVPTVTTKADPVDYVYSTTKAPFGIAVQRKSTNTVIFNSSVGGFIYADQFLQLSSLLPSSNLYGLGEHVSQLLLDLNWQSLTLFSRDQGTPTGEGHNLYGVHPFYINIENDGNANGVFLLNSNAMDIILQPTPAITYRPIGGVLDFYIFLGPTPADVVSQYTEVIGRPFMPPYWSLGFHLCRWGYNSLAETKKINDQMRANGVPQDVQWNDIDYMSNHLDFTYDNNTFNGLPQFVQSIHDQGQHYIMITDPGISDQQPKGSYAPYDDGVTSDVFIKNSAGKYWQGSVWPGPCNFPDFFHPQAQSYWQKQITSFHSSVGFDGLWIDMNECAMTGTADACGSNSYSHPPYVPNVPDGDINQKTICVDTLQYNNSLHYNLHSMYGYSEMIATMTSLQNVLKQRSLVISRSTFAGSGVHGGHWLGDNDSNWNDLYLSIPGLLSFQFFGIPMVGADICGFGGSTTAELCTRWMELGAFYPFSRNHNTIGAPDQDPVSLGPSVTNASRSALLIRYQLLPFLYTLFYRAHLSGETVARPLFFEFPNDKTTHNIDKQFLWGRSLLISPVLTQGATTVSAYFPAAIWYDLLTGQQVAGTGSSGVQVTLNAPLNVIPLHLRGGSVILTQKPEITTTASRKNPFTLIVTLDALQAATGDAFIDDGTTLNTYETGKYSYLTYLHNATLFTVTASKTDYTPPTTAYLEAITYYGFKYNPSSVKLNGTSVTYSYDTNNKVLKITALNVSAISGFSLILYQ